ncbi:MAG: hypothetical protein M1840_007444 [Geoglossum simile]|nr:MAG: hypothetical protein M1840_007444 [Geoglossum simile]
MDVDTSDIQSPSEKVLAQTPGESLLKTRSRVTRSVTRLKETAHSLSGGSGGNSGSGSQASQKAAPLKVEQRKSELGYCSCPVGVGELISSFAAPLSPRSGSYKAPGVSTVRINLPKSPSSMCWT